MTEPRHARLEPYLAPLAAFLALLIWEGLGQAGLLPRYIIPRPSEIGLAFYRDRQLLFFHLGVTLKESLIGLGLAVLLAWLLALLMDLVRPLYRVLYPFFVLTQTIPTIALAPILVLWLGYGILPKVLLIVLTTAFPLLVSILDGFRHCDPDMQNLLRLMRASPLQVLWHAKIPAALSYFYAGLRVSVSYAFIAAVVAEWLGGFEGLGVYMIRAKKLFQYDTMFAIIVLISAISLLGMRLVQYSEVLALPWKHPERRKKRQNTKQVTGAAPASNNKEV